MTASRAHPLGTTLWTNDTRVIRRPTIRPGGDAHNPSEGSGRRGVRCGGIAEVCSARVSRVSGGRGRAGRWPYEQRRERRVPRGRGPSGGCRSPLRLLTPERRRRLPDVSFYSIEVGSRGDLAYSRDELDDEDWTVHLTLGG